MHIVIFTGGEFIKSSLTEKILKEADIIFAADSGADTAVNNGIYPVAVIGDFDSISQKTRKILKENGAKFVDMPTTLLSSPEEARNSSEKDQTDTELAVRYAIEQGATKITILGGNAGDRFDHVISNLLLSAVISIPLHFVDGNQESWIEKGPATVVLNGKKDDLLSLIPINGNVEHISTENLQYPLKKDTLLFGQPRGVSNVLLEDTATVSFERGMLLFVHTHI